MRTTVVLLAIAVLAVAILGGCRAREDEEVDGALLDTARVADSVADRDTIATESASVASSAPRRSPERSTPAVRRTGDTVTDSTLPPDDSIRAMRPEMPQVTPPKRPRTWRGFKLPEEMPVRAPLETIQRVEPAPDSVMKGDSTKPPAS